MADPASRDRWIDAALEALEREGLAGVRVEVLARQLHVTKGSFYWHFRDRRDLLAAMLARWERTATQALIDRTEAAGGTAPEQLRHLFRLAAAEFRVELELALRAWGRGEPGVRRAVARVDRRRLRYMETLYRGLGLDAGEARARAFLSYSLLHGTRLVPGTEVRHRVEMLRRCEALLLRAPGA